MSTDAPVVLIACAKTRQPGSPSCGGRGSVAMLEALGRNLAHHGEDVRIETVQCLGRCTQGPNLRIKGGAFFTGVDSGAFEAIRRAIADHRAGRAAGPDAGAIPPSARG